MFPLNALLIGCEADILDSLSPQFANLGVRVEANFATVDRVIEQSRTQPDWNSPARTQGLPRLFIVHLKNALDTLPLKKLSAAFTGQPILVLVRAGNNPNALIRVMRDGATQVVMLPIAEEDFNASLDCIRIQFGRSGNQAPSIAVSGVTGGAGATSLAINASSEFATIGRIRTVLVEVAMQMGILATYLELEPRFTTFDLLKDGADFDMQTFDRALTPVAENFYVLPGPHDAISRMPVSSDQVMTLVDYAKRTAEVVVMDVPCTYDDFYFETLASANHVILVAQQKVPSIRALQLVRDTLSRENEMTVPILVINNYDAGISGFSAGRIQELLQVPKLWTIASDVAAFNASLNNGRPLRSEAPQSPALADIGTLVNYLLAEMGRGVYAETNQSFFKKVFQAVGLK